MEELKNLKNYNEFKDSLNEELLWGAIKNMFSKMFAGIDKKLSDKVLEFTKKLDASKTWQDSVRLLEQEFKDKLTIANEEMKASATPIAVRKVLKDNATTLFIELQSMGNKYQSKDVVAKTIFADKPEKVMFGFDKVEDFNNASMTSMNAKVLEINKLAGAGFNEVELKKQLEEAKTDAAIAGPEKGKKYTYTNKAGQSTNVTLTQILDDATGKHYQLKPDKGAIFAIDDPTRLKLVENVDYKIFEDITTGGATTQPVATQPVATQPTPTAAPSTGDIEKLKVAALKWLTDTIGVALTKVKALKQPVVATGTDPADTLSKQVKGTKFTDTVSKMLKNMVGTADQKTLLDIRKTLANNQKLGDDKSYFGPL